MLKPAVFFDRDGILNSLVFDDYTGLMAAPLDPKDLALERLAPKFVQGLNERGFQVILTTEQPAIAQGRMTTMVLDRIHGRLRAMVAEVGGRIDGVFVCPHDPDAQPVPGGEIQKEYATECRCRWPAPGLLLSAASVHQIDLSRSFMVCRDLRSVKAGRAATVETVLLTKAHMGEIEAPPELRPHHVAVDLLAVLQIIDSSRDAMLGE